MTAPDLRVIAPEDDRYNATLVARSDETESLAYITVKFDGPAVPFESGQYMTIGVMADGRLVQRPYSVASDPGGCRLPRATSSISASSTAASSRPCSGSCRSAIGCG